MRLLIATGSRLNEIAKAEWSWYSEKEGLIRVPEEAFKSGREHIIVLSSGAKAIVDSIPRNGPYMFSFNGRRPVATFGAAKARLDAQIKKALPGIEPWVFHDLRRVVRSGLARLA